MIHPSVSGDTGPVHCSLFGLAAVRGPKERLWWRGKTRFLYLGTEDRGKESSTPLCTYLEPRFQVEQGRDAIRIYNSPESIGFRAVPT